MCFLMRLDLKNQRGRWAVTDYMLPVHEEFRVSVIALRLCGPVSNHHATKHNQGVEENYMQSSMDMKC
jgi:hypothetical protein